MKDKQGTIRGKCTSVGCQCTEYVKLQDLSSVRCDFCKHAPVKHIEVFNNALGACTNCTSCYSYESEESGTYSNCAYCECPALYHKNADSKPPASGMLQSASIYATMSTQCMSSTVSVGPLRDGPTGQLAIFQAPAPFRCKLPRCNNSCFTEVNGRVHDFCSKAHAIAYTQLQDPPTMQSSEPSSRASSFMPQVLEGKFIKWCS